MITKSNPFNLAPLLRSKGGNPRFVLFLFSHFTFFMGCVPFLDGPCPTFVFLHFCFAINIPIFFIVIYLYIEFHAKLLRIYFNLVKHIALVLRFLGIYSSWVQVSRHADALFLGMLTYLDFHLVNILMFL